MKQGFRVTPARTEAELDAARALFGAYSDSLPVDLAYQDFASELAALPGCYAPPEGDLWLAFDGEGEPVGCVALRAAGDGACELKRLYLLTNTRGLGLGRKLAEVAIDRARELGYRELRLDTLPTMGAAVELYQRMGFVRTAPYYAPTPPGTVFMALKL